MMNTSLTDRIVLVTGASSGIGEACAMAFAEAGAKLILAARRMDRLEALRDRIAARHDRPICLLQFDVRDVGVVTRVLEDLPPEWAAIEVLVNNAGLSRGLDTVAAGDTQDWDEMIDTNIKGLLYVTRAVLPGMIKRGAGHVINISSISGTEVYPNGAVYCGTKASVDAISRGLRMDLLGTPIRATNIQPGMTETEFSLVRFHGDQERAGHVYEGVVPLSGPDVAEAVLFAATRAPHVNIDTIMLKPVAQASTTMVART